MLMIGLGSREFKEREFEAFHEFSHERKVKGIDRVAGKVIVRIPKEGGVRDHERRQSCIPEGGVVAQARFGQDPSIKGKEKGLGWQTLVPAEPSQHGTP
jgi:hypothetical protein